MSYCKNLRVCDLPFSDDALIEVFSVELGFIFSGSFSNCPHDISFLHVSIVDIGYSSQGQTIQFLFRIKV